MFLMRIKASEKYTTKVFFISFVYETLAGGAMHEVPITNVAKIPFPGSMKSKNYNIVTQ